ncbi:hypothetical protein J8I26_10490 [Herbaspirillum sp. LeCh32-8]|uniref:hypothetical protein n=1 Tax=Herbaspirillum sp. LeCh32-8 TaxID=2821356 RepID=UPI001AE52D73|nr:hypothetical protein [Herbaspirillum sp. LeCh32-8]MBP0598533.1 hypothetical protein [Herbaspirillum sp. LeCh32-8]
MHTELSSPPTCRRTPLARLRALLAAPLRSDLLWLASCVFAMLAILLLVDLAVEHFLPPAPAVSARVASSGVAPADKKVLYRACVREARARSLPVNPYPPEGESVSFVHERQQLFKRTEALEADVDDMSVDNGCQVKLRASGRIETAPADAVPQDLRKMTQWRPSHSDALDAALAEADSEAPRCPLQRDVSLQSHYMLLKLCNIERRPAAQRPDEARRKPSRVIRQPTT